MTTVINIFGGPGAGKSTVASGVFYELKMRGVNCELITEYAKEVTWEESLKKLENQLYVFAKQHHRMWNVSKKVDVIITDSPLLLSSIYNLIYNYPGKTNMNNLDNNLNALILEYFQHFDNTNFLLERVKPYTKVGRNQTKSQAIEIDKTIENYLDWYEFEYTKLPGDDKAKTLIVADYNYWENSGG